MLEDSALLAYVFQRMMYVQRTLVRLLLPSTQCTSRVVDVEAWIPVDLRIQ